MGKQLNALSLFAFATCFSGCCVEQGAPALLAATEITTLCGQSAWVPLPLHDGDLIDSLEFHIGDPLTADTWTGQVSAGRTLVVSLFEAAGVIDVQLDGPSHRTNAPWTDCGGGSVHVFYYATDGSVLVIFSPYPIR